MPPTIKVTKTSRLPQLKADLKRLVNTDVLVGWPESAAGRNEEGVTNPQLAYIHTNGSPLQNIPARPILQPAISEPENNRLIGEQLGKAAQDVLQGKPEAAENDLHRTGMLATNIVKRWFVNPANSWAPNAPSTIARKGSARPLIDTGQLRRSATYVVRDKK